jgi:hypothetical protein
VSDPNPTRRPELPPYYKQLNRKKAHNNFFFFFFGKKARGQIWGSVRMGLGIQLWYDKGRSQKILGEGQQKKKIRYLEFFY